MQSRSLPACSSRPRQSLLFALIIASACTGVATGEAPGARPGPGAAGGRSGTMLPMGSGGDPSTPPAGDPGFGGPSGLRRLTRREYDNTIRDLLGDASARGFAKLPEDANDPFDNDYTTQLVSGALIDAAETLAAQAAAAAVADPARRAMLVGCTPAGPDDAACLRSFITSFGRRAFRRPLEAAEIDAYAGFGSFAVETKNFFTAVELVLRAMLQDPSFLYRVEAGEPVAGDATLYRLGDFEIATRLSYLLWGTMPSDALLELAAGGRLTAAEDRRTAALMLLGDPRGRERLRWFHAFWLGYHQLPFPAELATALRGEADALVDKIVFGGGQDYLSLFSADQTFLTATLATHYGLPAPSVATGAWVPYGPGLRRGILSQGAVLSVGAKFDDTSPTLRGVFVRNRLLCQVVPPPPPNVDVDQPPASMAAHACKVDRYRAHTSGGCADCHDQLDPIGFGLENFDSAGRYRAVEKADPACAIEGNGEVVGVGTFKGPAELGALLVGTGEMEACVVRQLYHFAVGRREVPADEALLESLTRGFGQKGRAFDELLLDLVASPAFAHRRVED
jgi:hypothetical protein